MRLALAFAATAALLTPTAALAQISQSKDSDFAAVIAACEKRDVCKGNWRNITYDIEDMGTTLRPTTGFPWRVQCYFDRMTDRKSCHLSSPKGYSGGLVLWLFWTQGSRQPTASIYSSEDKYPGSVDELRVDKLPRFVFPEDGNLSVAQTALLLAQMRNGADLQLRSTLWPTRAYDGGSVDLEDFSDIYTAARALALNYLS